MTRDEILDKAARAMFDARNPDPVGQYGATQPAWMISALHNNRSIFTTGLDAVEDDIRRDERQRITNWLRECAERPELRFHKTALTCMAHELDRRPIEG